MRGLRTLVLNSHASREAKIEFGEAVAAKLKLSKDGTKVLYPQPTDSPECADHSHSIHLT